MLGFRKYYTMSIYKIGLLIKGSLLLVFTFCTINVFAQQKGSIGKSVYKLNSDGLSIQMPDTIFKQLGIQAENVKLPLGTIFYRNYYFNGLSRTDISFEVNDGIRGSIQASPVSFFSRQKDSAFYQVEEGKAIETYKCFSPALTKANVTTSINSYQCEKYDYTGQDSSKVTVWFCNKLPYWVSPGVYYKTLGGIVRIDYTYQNKNWSLDLLSFEKTNEKIDFNETILKPPGANKVHPMFKTI